MCRLSLTCGLVLFHTTFLLFHLNRSTIKYKQSSLLFIRKRVFPSQPALFSLISLTRCRFSLESSSSQSRWMRLKQKELEGVVTAFLSFLCWACSSGNSLHLRSICRSLAFCVWRCASTKCLAFPYLSYILWVVMEMHWGQQQQSYSGGKSEQWEEVN